MTFCKPAGKKPMNSEVLLRSLRSFRPLPTRSTFLDGVESVVAREGFATWGSFGENITAGVHTRCCYTGCYSGACSRGRGSRFWERSKV